MRGRPRKENSRNVMLSVRLMGLEDELLKELCTKTGKTKGQILRKALLYYYNYKLFGIIMSD